MPTRNVVLTDHHEELIAGLVKSGRYQNASEVLREGLRLIEKRENDHAAKLEALRAAVQVGIDASERGDYIEFDNFDDLDVYLRTLGDDILDEEASDEPERRRA